LVVEEGSRDFHKTWIKTNIKYWARDNDTLDNDMLEHIEHCEEINACHGVGCRT